MQNIIEINNLTFKIDNKTIFNNINLNIKRGDFLTLTGSCSCGKTTLIKILLGLIKAEGNIKINNLNLNDINLIKIRKLISVVFENPNDNFITDIVIDNLIFSLENLCLTKQEINSRINEICEQLKIKDILNLSISNLSGSQKQLVALAMALIKKPDVLILDDSLTMLNQIKKEKILNFLKKLNSSQKTTIINCTKDMEDSIYSKTIAVINKKEKCIIKDKKEKLYENEKLFKDNNLELPFMASLCNKLKYYELVNDMILDMDKMVNKLWK
ncbi:MAG: energy-coupling factor ABC transporter ATP-binding protein [Bacilli bacterium]|nr:energy-coupling factor ABC transporter ATP-binding protein [Bacilli bacterium]